MSGNDKNVSFFTNVVIRKSVQPENYPTQKLIDAQSQAQRPANQNLLVIGQVWAESPEKYFVERKVSHGEISDVYFVTSQKGKFAMKVEMKLANDANPSKVEKIVYDTLASNSKMIKSGLFLKLIDFIETQDKIALVLPRMMCDLQSYVEKMLPTKRLSEFQSIGCILRLISAINYLHLCGIVHRDIKPSNIMVDEDNNFKGKTGPLKIVLGDFGISHEIVTIDSETGEKRRRPMRDFVKFVGTMQFASIRQLKQEEFSQACDIYIACLTTLSVTADKKLPWIDDLDLKVHINKREKFDCTCLLKDCKFMSETIKAFTDTLNATAYTEWNAKPNYKQFYAVFKEIYDYCTRNASLKKS